MQYNKISGLYKKSTVSLEKKLTITEKKSESSDETDRGKKYIYMYPILNFSGDFLKYLRKTWQKYDGELNPHFCAMELMDS